MTFSDTGVGVVDPPDPEDPPELGGVVGPAAGELVTGVGEADGETVGETEAEILGDTVGDTDGETVGEVVAVWGLGAGAWYLGNALTLLQFLKALSSASRTQRFAPVPPSTKSLPLPPKT
jgi:hypothetical protein